MKRTFGRILAAGVVMGAFAFGGFQAGAIPITGGIGFLGGYTPNNSDLTVATSVTIDFATVGSHSGDFSGIGLGTAVTMSSPLSVNPPSFPIAALWSVGGFTFDLTSQAEVPAPTASSLTLEGIGTITGGGKDPTSGTWTATFNSRGGGTFTWSSSSSAAVPDGGATVAMLGMALAGMAFLRKVVG